MQIERRAVPILVLLPPFQFSGHHDGKRAAPVRIELPFQTAETVEVRAGIVARRVGRSANLIYIDPPLDTSADSLKPPKDKTASFSREPSSN